MAFTDSELNRLKEAIEHRELSLCPPNLSALISRLEAAEKALNFAESYVGFQSEPGLERLDAWRKSCGREA